MKLMFVFVACAFLAGCANGYSQFYRPTPGATPEAIAATRESPAPSVPRLIEAGSDPKVVVESMARDGYGVIGVASFSSGHNAPEKEALEQGSKVGADVVIVMSPSYAGSVTSSIPITTPTSQTSYTTGNATAYGSGGVVNAYGSSTTTTYGSKTDYIPFTVNRYNYGAIYLVKRKFILGVNWRDLNDAERQQLQTNQGVYVTLVVNGSPAFRSDILPGDVILAVNGQAVEGAEGATQMLKGLDGQTINLTIARNGKWIKKAVTLGR